MAELQVQDKVAKEQVYVIEDLERPLLAMHLYGHLLLNY